MPDTPGRRLKVFTAGLHQLGARCPSLGGTLSAEAVPSFVAASSWQSNAGAVNKYSAAGTDYTETDEDGAGGFGGLAV
jgi:hypothetical protein